MSITILPWLLFVSLPAAVLFLAAGHQLGRAKWLPKWSHPIAAWGVVSAAGYLTFWAFFLHQSVGIAVSWALPTLALGILARAWYRTRDLRAMVASYLGTNLLITLGIGSAYLGFLGLWHTPQNIDWIAANRFLPALPVDNEIPRVFADRLQQGMSPRMLIAEWLSSDRPPLQAGVILLLRQPALLAGGDNHTVSFLASMLFQLSWIPGLWCLLAGLGARAREASLVVVACALTGFCLLHSVYGWPKLGAAGLVLGGAGLLLFARCGNGPFAVGAALCALGYLGHGGVMFSLLALAPFILARRPGLSPLVTAAACFLAVAAPWMSYQKFYEPPGNRLIKWHLAGVIPVDARGTLETLKTSYREKSPAEIWANKKGNIDTLFTALPWRSFPTSFRSSGEQRSAEFFHFFRGLGIGSWWTLLFPLIALRLWRARQHPIALAGGALLAWSALTLAVWVLLMFGPATTLIHQGSLVPLVVMWAIPAFLLLRAVPWLFAVVIPVQVWLLILVWAPPSHLLKATLVLDSLLLAILGFAAAFALAWRRTSDGDPERSSNPRPCFPLSPLVRRPLVLVAAAGLVALKLWLVGAQSIFALGFASHDDALFINRAQDLLNGNWLGTYHQLTLAHAPMYPLFIAAMSALHVPLFTAQHWLYIISCAAVVAALRPLLSGRWLACALFGVLLFNPVTFDSIIHGRVLRQNLIPSLTLLVFAGYLGFLARRNEPVARATRWLAVSAIALPAFWLTRNESVWVLPGLGILTAGGAALLLLERNSGLRIRLALLVAVPVAGWSLGVGTVAAVNWRVYGVFATTEFKQRDFADAYGALCRVEPAKWRQFIHVPREVRERLYPLSPAFAELQPHLEGDVGLAWASISAAIHHIPATEREIGAGWFMWALRDAVIRAGHGESAAEVAGFYRRLAKEVNEACDRGLVAAGPRRSGFVPPLRREHLAPFRESLRAAFRMMVHFDKMAVRAGPSAGSPDELERFASLTRGRLSPAEGAEARPVWLESSRLDALEKLLRAYSFVSPWAGLASLLAFATAVGLAVHRRIVPIFAVVAIALASSIGALLAIIALVNATSFPAISNAGYFSGSYALWLFFCISCWLALFEVRNRERADPMVPVRQPNQTEPAEIS